MAFEAYATVKGVKQGQFHGESTKPKQTNLIPIVAFQNKASFSTDPATGAATSKLQHTPIVITKQWGAASPQFFEALVTQETLSTVSFTFDSPTSKGVEQTFFTIVLTNALICGIQQYVGSAPGLSDAANALEDISFTYQKIEITDTIAKTSAVDNW
jgi:type VI secretion system secreted protein Hcp